MSANVDLIARLRAEGAETTRSALSGVNDSLNKLGTLAISGAVAGVTALGVGFVASVNKAADFQQAMSNVGAISLASAEDLAKLEAAALSAGSTTAFTATEAAEGLAFLAMAGFDVNDSITALPSVLAAASAGNMDLATTADIVSNVLGGFQMDASEAARVADVLALAGASANTDITMLGQTMKYVAPIANNLGYSLESATAAAGMLGDAGVQSGMAGRHLRSIMLSLAVPTGRAAKELERMGVNTRWASGEMKGLDVIISEMETAMGSLTLAQKDFALEAIFGTEAAGSFSILLGRGGEALGDFTHELEGASEVFDGMGAAQAMAAMQLDNFRGSMTLLRSAVDGAMVTIGGYFLPTLQRMAENAIPMVESALQQVTPILDYFGQTVKFVSNMMKNGVAPFDAFVRVLKRAGQEGLAEFVVGLKNLGETFMETIQPVVDFVSENVKLQDILVVLAIAVASVVVPALLSMLAAFAAFAAPILALIALVALLRTAWENDWGGIQGKTADVLSFLQSAISTAVKNIQNWWETSGKGLVSSTVDTFGKLRASFNAGLAFVTSLVQRAWQNIQNFWNAYGSNITNITTNMWTAISAIFTGVLNTIVSFLSARLAFILSLTQSVWGRLQSIWQTYGNSLTTIVSAIGQGVVGFFQSMFEVILGLTQTVLAAINGDWEGFKSGLLMIAQGLMNLLSTAFRTGLTVISELIAIAVQDILTTFGRPDWGSAGADIVRGVASGIRGAAGDLIAAVTDMANNALDTLKDLLGIQSPSVEFYKLGKFTTEGFVDALIDGQRAVSTAMNDLVQMPDMSMSNGMAGMAMQPAMSGASGGGGNGAMTINVYIDGGTPDMQSSARNGVTAALQQAGINADIRRRI